VTFNTLDYISAQAASFNGTTNLLQYSTNTGFMTNAFINLSIMLWVKPTSLTGIQTIYEEGGDDNNRNRRMGIILRLNGTNLEASMRDRGAAASTFSAPYPTDSKWHFIAFTYANGNAILYIDGVSVGTLATGLGDIRRHRDPGAFGASNTRDIFNNNATNSYYAGLMDEAAYYYSVLTPANILDAYKCMKPGYDFGDAPVSYGATDHKMVNNLFLGTTTDDDTGNWGDGVDANGNATDDDTPGDPAGGIDDEDSAPGLTFISDTAASFSVDVYTTNTTTAAATLFGWIDFNKNGTFETSESASIAVPMGSNNTVVTLNWTGLSGLTPGTAYLRLRLTTDTAVTTATPTGSAINGEAEDYQLPIAGLPQLTVLKLANASTAKPGSTLTYSVTVVNTGSGVATNVIITDLLSQFTSLALDPFGNGNIFQFSDGANPSGMPGTAASVTYSNTGSAPFSHIAVDDGSGHDPNIKAFKIILDGTMNANTGSNPSFTVQYKVLIKCNYSAL